MPLNKRILFNVRSTGSIPDATSVGNSFNSSKKSTLDLHSTRNRTTRASYLPSAGSNFIGFVEGIRVIVSSISSATKITIKVTTGADGTDIVIPDTEATIALEVGSTTSGAAVFNLNKFPWANSTDKLYVFFKTDTGTLTVDKTFITWSQ